MDFDGKIDVVPVSDPNIPSSAHRLMLSQLALQLASQAPPGTYNIQALHRTILQAANMPNLEAILPPQAQPQAQRQALVHLETQQLFIIQRFLHL